MLNIHLTKKQCKELQDYKDRKVYKVFKDFKDLRVHKVFKEFKENKVFVEKLVEQVLQVL
jgi:hypothetical protein